MCLEVTRFREPEAGVGIRTSDHSLLCSGRRQINPWRPTIVVDGGAADHGTNRITILQGLFQGFDKDDADPLASGVSVCCNTLSQISM